MSRAPIALTCGDPAGVGPELIRSWLADPRHARTAVVPIGPAGWIRELGGGAAVGPADFIAAPGKSSDTGHAVALAAMERAAEGCRKGEFSAVVTGPVNKRGLASVGFRHPGQTEFFAEQWGGEPVMAFAGGRMTVALATWHTPLARVPRELTAGRVTAAVTALDPLLTRLGRGRRIGVCGLNPHAGESGLFGREEIDIISPAILRAQQLGLSVTGPWPGDTIFMRARGHREFDVVIAQYHDQGLIPIKYLGLDQGVNITLGLPFIRTSVDHGTAFDLVGKNTADPSSLLAAIALADRFASQAEHPTHRPTNH